MRPRLAAMTSIKSMDPPPAQIEGNEENGFVLSMFGHWDVTVVILNVKSKIGTISRGSRVVF